MSTLWQDLRYGVRMITKSPGFTLLAVMALALGICANTTIFSFVNGLVLRPLIGVKEPERLVAVYTSDFSSGLYGGSSYPDYLDFRNQADAFEGLAAYEETVLNLTGGAEAERIRGAIVTGNFFDVLGVTAHAGRTLHAADEATSGSEPVVISHALWQRRFNSDPAILGSSLKLSGKAYTIVGITAESFRGLRMGAPPEFWIPITKGSEWSSAERGDRGLELTGRLKPGVSIAQAQAQITTIGARLAQAYPESNLGTLERPNDPRPMTVAREALIAPSAQSGVWRVSLLLFGVVGLVLLIACANVANLLLARASGRRREIATRLALGAGRSRLVRQLLTESLLLAFLGGAVGLVVTLWTSGLLPRFFPPTESGGLDLSLDWRVLGFTSAVVLLTGVLFGLAPALKATRTDLVTSLKDDAGSYGHRLRRLGLRDALVISQLALSLVLLIGAALFVRSLQHALEADPGFASQNLLLASIEAGGTGVSEEQGKLFYQQMLERVGTVPGVGAVSLTVVTPISGGGQRRGVQLEGYQPQENEDTELNTNVVGLNYFNTMSIPLVQGRDFNVQDREGSGGVVIVNEELARRYFPGQSAVGKRLRMGSDSPYREIVGVARTAKYRNLREQPLPFIYLPFAQEYQSRMTLLVRTTGDPTSLIPALRNEIHALNNDVPVFAVHTMAEHIGAQLAADRMVAVLLSVFGGAALLLAAIGIYGVMAYSVAQRTHEIGIRIALGAERRDIFKLIVGQGLMLILIGAALGLALALALTRVLKNLLFDVSASDPLTFGVIALLLIAVALLACYLPARRATKVNPLVALRYE
jgi:predicted permease